MTGIVGIPVIITGQPALKNPQGTKNRLIKRLLGRNRHEVAHHIAATKPAKSKGKHRFRPNRDERPGGDGRPAQGNKSHLVKNALENKSSRNDRPTNNERPPQEGRKKSEAAPSRGKKKPFGSKPIFKKRPNFGDKPSPQDAWIRQTQKWGITATCYAQKTQQSKKQCIPARRSRHIETTAINIDAHIRPI